jgi:hypothetical protein
LVFAALPAFSRCAAEPVVALMQQNNIFQRLRRKKQQLFLLAQHESG